MSLPCLPLTFLCSSQLPPSVSFGNSSNAWSPGSSWVAPTMAALPLGHLGRVSPPRQASACHHESHALPRTEALLRCARFVIMGALRTLSSPGFKSHENMGRFLRTDVLDARRATCYEGRRKAQPPRGGRERQAGTHLARRGRASGLQAHLTKASRSGLCWWLGDSGPLRASGGSHHCTCSFQGQACCCLRLPQGSVLYAGLSVCTQPCQLSQQPLTTGLASPQPPSPVPPCHHVDPVT